MSQDPRAQTRPRRARLRLAIIGPLLASPPELGHLAGRISELAGMSWKHPTTGEAIRFSDKTIERMYYLARNEADPVRALERKVPKHARWSYQLHHDNLAVLVKRDPSLGTMVGYATVCRFLKDHGLVRQRGRLRRRGKGSEAAVVVPRETRSYEVAHVNALWHYDFHEGRRQVVTASGELKTPYLFGILDDCSRVCCHAQWYEDEENSEDLVHGFCQGIQKRRVPRATIRDRGGAMAAAEVVQGLERLGIVDYPTLPYSPQQNAKQENFWTRIEERLMPIVVSQALS